ncbi:HD domain-containing protein [Pyrococcus kukulkanii]|uniref:HD Cas3-type domain-containing protein n=1 Tax=Pyrococcus kukulkanii TaxID=1609559 RepID=A0ABV4T829_9EURY
MAHLEGVHEIATRVLRPWTRVVVKDLKKLLGSKRPKLVVKITLKGHDVGKFYEPYLCMMKRKYKECGEIYRLKGYRRKYHAVHSVLILRKCSVMEKLTEDERAAIYFAIARHHEYFIDDIRKVFDSAKKTFDEGLVLWDYIEKVLDCKALPTALPPDPLWVRPKDRVLTAGIELLNLLTLADNIEAKRRRENESSKFFDEILDSYILLSKLLSPVL